MIVRIWWHDTHPEAGWQAPGAMSDGPRVIESVGFLLVGEKAGHHTIAQDRDAEAGTWNGVSHIPSSCVVRVEEL